MFKIILDYLRSGYLKDLTESSLKELEVEAEYFMLSSLQKIINQRKDVNVIYEGKTFKCKSYALQYCDEELIDYKGDFNARVNNINLICPLQMNECDCGRPHETTLEDLMRRVLRRLEDNRVGDVEPSEWTELWEDSGAAQLMGLLPSQTWFGQNSSKWFY